MKVQQSGRLWIVTLNAAEWRKAKAAFLPQKTAKPATKGKA